MTWPMLDLRMPEMTGLELLEQMNQLGITTPVVFITAYADVPNAVNAMKFGAIDFLQKPITPDQLRDDREGYPRPPCPGRAAGRGAA